MTEIKEATPVEESLRVIAESLQGIEKSLGRLRGIERTLDGIGLLLLLAFWFWRHWF